MKIPRFERLATRLLLLTALWVSFVVGVVAYTMLLNWNTERTANALNEVNEIKVHYQRANIFANSLYTAEKFDRELVVADKLVKRLSATDIRSGYLITRAPEIDADIADVVRKWNDSAAPQLFRQRNTNSVIDPVVFYDFIWSMDKLKADITSCRQQFLTQVKMLQIMIMTLAIGSLFVILYLLQRWVIRPVSALSQAIEEVRRGNLSARVHLKPGDEFGRIGEGFNRMAESLDDLYSNLETKVAEKTASVQEKNTNLSQLYEMTMFLSQSSAIDDMTEGFLERIRSYTKCDACTVRLMLPGSDHLRIVASSGLSGKFLEAEERDTSKNTPSMRSFSRPLPVRFDLKKPETRTGEALKAEGFCTAYGFHIRNGQTTLGIFEVFFRGEKDIDSPAFRQLEAFGTHLGTAVENNLLNERERQFAVVQERTFMAQGLHDSIAQTLSFLNMQVQLLESALASNDKLMIGETVNQIKAGVQESYENVRELLLNFREKIHNEDFETAIQTVSKRFEAQAGVPCRVTFEGNGSKLTEKEKLQITFIVQEALSNVRKHARASSVEVKIRNGRDFTAEVIDNGVGIDLELAAARKARHVGLSIMEERAKKIGAELSVKSSLGQGTSVCVLLKAANRNS